MAWCSVCLVSCRVAWCGVLRWRGVGLSVMWRSVVRCVMVPFGVMWFHVVWWCDLIWCMVVSLSVVSCCGVSCLVVNVVCF